MYLGNAILVYYEGSCNYAHQYYLLCSWNAAYESLLGSNKPFPQPIPLHVRSNAFQFQLTILMYCVLLQPWSWNCRRWSIFLWTSGSKRGCMTSTNAFIGITCSCSSRKDKEWHRFRLEVTMVWPVIHVFCSWRPVVLAEHSTAVVTGQLVMLDKSW